MTVLEVVSYDDHICYCYQPLLLPRLRRLPPFHFFPWQLQPQDLGQGRPEDHERTFSRQQEEKEATRKLSLVKIGRAQQPTIVVLYFVRTVVQPWGLLWRVVVAWVIREFWCLGRAETNVGNEVSSIFLVVLRSLQAGRCRFFEQSWPKCTDDARHSQSSRNGP